MNKCIKCGAKLPSAAYMLGAIGGSKKTQKKAEAARRNGKKGGRPKQSAQ